MNGVFLILLIHGVSLSDIQQLPVDSTGVRIGQTSVMANGGDLARGRSPQSLLACGFFLSQVILRT